MSALALLYEPAPVAMAECSKGEANELLAEWEHPLGPCNRPFHQEHHLLVVAGEPVALTVSASTVSPTISTHRRNEVVELARIARAPDAWWAMRPALRIWRQVFAPRWETWPVAAAYAYALPGTEGDIYRFDGWELVGTVGKARAGKSSTWSNPSAADGIGDGRKKLWRYVYGDRKQLASDTPPADARQLASDEKARD